jgi:5-methylcytosine-specific restriction endonuclease McrA
MPSKPKLFRPRHAPSPAQQTQRYDAERGSARQRGYTAAWDRAAKGFKAEHPLCLGCEAVGRIKAADVADHIIPHKGDRVLFWLRSNWQPACDWHHDVVKQKLERLFAQGKATASDLRLDSPMAVTLTLELLGEGEGEGGQKSTRFSPGPVG